MIETLERIPAVVLDRQTVGDLFRLRKTAACALMRSAGATGSGAGLLIGKRDLLLYLARQLSNPHHQEARGCAQRIGQMLVEAEATDKAHRIRIRPVAYTSTVAGLPPTIQLAPGRLVIDFHGTEDLLAQLHQLGQAMISDYPRLEEICSLTECSP